MTKKIYLETFKKCPRSLYFPLLNWDGLRDHLRDAPWEDIFKLSASSAASEFCEWVQVGIDVYIPHRKYQVKLHSSLWFSKALHIRYVRSSPYQMCAKLSISDVCERRDYVPENDLSVFNKTVDIELTN